MDKWRCIPCNYIYDSTEGDPGGISPLKQRSKIFLMTGFVPYEVLARMNLKR